MSCISKPASHVTEGEYMAKNQKIFAYQNVIETPLKLNEHALVSNSLNIQVVVSIKTTGFIIMAHIQYGYIWENRFQRTLADLKKGILPAPYGWALQWHKVFILVDQN